MDGPEDGLNTQADQIFSKLERGVLKTLTLGVNRVDFEGCSALG